MGRLLREVDDVGEPGAGPGAATGQPLARVDVRILAGVEVHRRVVRGVGDDLAVPVDTGTGRDQLADDDVLLETTQAVVLALDRGLGQHTRRLLERGGRQPRVGGERRLGDAHEHRSAVSGALALLDQ